MLLPNWGVVFYLPKQRIQGNYRTETFGSCLKSYRKRERLTIFKAASLMNLSSFHLCDIEKGRRIPPKGESLNKNYGCSPFRRRRT